MPSDGKQLLTAYRRMDDALVRARFPRTSEAWMRALEAFWLSGRTRMVVRKGRQSGFSTTMARVAVCTGLFGTHRINPGTRLAIPFVSITVPEARERLYNIRRILDALGVTTRQTAEAIEVADDEHPPIVWRTLACDFRTAVGLTAASAFEDEMARWTNDDGSANPAPEVDAAITPMGVTQPNFRIYSGSSPLSTEDFHAELVERGDTKHQQVFEGPSWFWNPTISEEDTHRLQPDERRWLREFGGKPVAARNAAFDADAIDAAFAHVRPSGTDVHGRRIIVLDPSSGKKDAFTFAAVGWISPSPNLPPNERFAPYLCFQEVDGIHGTFWRHLSGDQIADRIKQLAERWGATEVHADQREELMLRSAIEKRGLSYVVHPWSAVTKPLAVERVRRWFADKLVALPKHDRLRSELLAFEERITPSGAFTFGARGSGHDDFVALLLTSAMAEIAGSLQPGGTGERLYRIEHDPDNPGHSRYGDMGRSFW